MEFGSWDQPEKDRKDDRKSRKNQVGLKKGSNFLKKSVFRSALDFIVTVSYTVFHVNAGMIESGNFQKEETWIRRR
jgi:hypothetical protein